MDALRKLTARPELVVDPAGSRLVGVDFQIQTSLGIDGPFGRERVVSALPLNKSKPVQLAAPQVITDNQGLLLFDPISGTVLGESAAVWVHRMLYAEKTIDTRRL